MILAPEADAFADLLRSLRPYLDDIVFIGGWVHALLLWEGDPGARPLHTTDVDVTLPSKLPAEERASLLELIRAAGFSVEVIDEATGLTLIHRGAVDLDLLAEAGDPREVIPVEGQEPLAVQGYAHLGMLLSSSRVMEVGKNLHESLDPPLKIRVPTLPAYVIGKAISAQGRTSELRRAKDLVYIYQMLVSEEMARQLSETLPLHLPQYPEAGRAAATALRRLLDDSYILRKVAHQLVESGVFAGSEEPLADFLARLRRFLAEVERALEGSAD